ncbi:Zn-dependent protease with chaperone function [Kitasatospora sp. GP30]|uniref:M56 family metallopeptidase n=1 Tax=Kitasatospora sp. GP30 TaxID=3035084 RepID=UPI000C70BDB7|nr:M56 family metallopeptidase [Kitasatospora sp. GP30]MDH6145316.1 Zn-dependent protease with chaperone function [Kitasatospora sp. GP30]
MGPSFLAPLIVSGTLALAAPRLATRLAPRPAAWALATAGASAATTWLGALALLAFTGFGQIRAVADRGLWSVWYLRSQEPVSRLGAGLCGLLLLLGVALVLRASWRRGRVLLQARHRCRTLPVSGDLAVLDDPVPEAFALPGAPGRVVVSTGMLRVVAGVELAALMAHERAHLRHRHHRFLLAYQLCAAACPLLRPLAREGAFAVERWADEEGAMAVGDRAAMARAVGRAALARKADPGPQALPAATGGPVPRRMRALLAPPPATRRAPLAAAATLALGCLVSLGFAAHTTEDLFRAARHAYVQRHSGAAADANGGRD